MEQLPPRKANKMNVKLQSIFHKVELLIILLSGFWVQLYAGSISGNTQAGATTNYTFQFSYGAGDTLFPDSQVDIEFPAGFNVSGVLIASSPDINGGFSVNPTGQIIEITRDATGDTLAPSSYEISFGIVTNPTTVVSAQNVKPALCHLQYRPLPPRQNTKPVL